MTNYDWGRGSYTLIPTRLTVDLNLHGQLQFVNGMSYRPPLVLPRGLIFLSSVWLIASWVIAIGVRAPVQPSSASYTPAVALMLQCVTGGLLIAWPLLRLSQTRPIWPLRQTLLDLAVLLGLVQVVIWPLRLVTTWTAVRTAAIDATLAGWTALAGALVAAAIITDRSGPRIFATAACLAICLLGPLLAWIGVVAGVDSLQLVGVSPFMTVNALASGGGSHPTDAQWQGIALLGMTSLAVWGALAVSRLFVPRDGATSD